MLSHGDREMSTEEMRRLLERNEVVNPNGSHAGQLHSYGDSMNV